MHRKLTGWALLLMLVFFSAGCAKRQVTDSQMAQPAARTQAIPEEASSVRPDVVEADPAWFACQKDGDCVTVKGPCSEPQALNARFETDFTVYRQRLERMIDCARNAKMAPTDPPRCLKNRCTLTQ